MPVFCPPNLDLSAVYQIDAANVATRASKTHRFVFNYAKINGSECYLHVTIY